jgi:hypothetical protein
MKIDSYLSGILLVTFSSALSILGLLGVRRVLRSKDLISCHDVGGYLLSVVGTMYGVILGLIVVDSMAKFQQARMTTEQEANSLADLVLLSGKLPPEVRDRIEALSLAYIELVIDEEWPLLDNGRHSPRARMAAIRLIDAVCQFEPRTESEKAIYAAELEAICDFWDSRRVRTVTAMHGVPLLQWIVLLIGAMVTVTFTYFFKIEHLKVQVMMTAMVSTIISLNLYLVLMFGYPFSGEVKVEPDCFNVAREIIGRELNLSPPPPGPAG